MDLGRLDHVALLGNFLPRKCGIATYTTDSYQSLRDRFPELQVDVYAMDDRPEGYTYPPAVVRSIQQDDRADYIEAARAIESSGAQVLWLQHEFGIFGGPAGDAVLALLDRITIPVVVALHTVLEQPDPDQRRVTEALLRRAARVTVMAERGRETLVRVYGARRNMIAVVPHGVPDRDFADPNDFKDRFGWQGRDVILTFGLLSPGKGIETMITALPAIVSRASAGALCGTWCHPPAILSSTKAKPIVSGLAAQAAELGVGGHIQFIDEFVEHDALIDRLQAADIYVTPYHNPAQVTSGTLAYAVGVGKAVVSTPYIHATEILSDGHGVLVDFGDAAAFAREVGGPAWRASATALPCHAAPMRVAGP